MKKKIVQVECVRKIPDHDCALSLEDDPSQLRIYQGCFVQFRRLLWKWVTISPSDPESKRYLRSAAQIHQESIRHLDHFPYVIHPFSQGRYFWEMFMIPVWFLTFIYIPLMIASRGLIGNKTHISLMKLILDIIGWIDIAMWFFTGYYDKRKQVVVLRFRNIARRYICSYFIFDLVSTQPITIYLRCFGPEVARRYHFVTAILLMKGIRVMTFIKYVCKYSERTGKFRTHIKLLTFTYGVIILMIWCVCLVYMMVFQINPGVASRRILDGVPMLMTAIHVTRTLMVVGVAEAMNSNLPFMILEIVFITAGSILETVLIAKVMQVYQKRTSSKNKYNSLVEEISEYMKYKELPTRLRAKILKYVDFKFQKHIFNEDDVLNNLSSVLKHDILLQRCQRMIEKVEFFQNLPEHVMLRIVRKLRSEIFLPRDIIVLAGYAGNTMYFIYSGTVAIYTETGKEICHIEDGGHFGEIALIINAPRVATVVAIKECELYKLSRKDFQEAIEPFPVLNKKIRESALKRLQTTMQIMSDEMYGGEKPSEDDEREEEEEEDKKEEEEEDEKSVHTVY